MIPFTRDVTSRLRWGFSIGIFSTNLVTSSNKKCKLMRAIKSTKSCGTSASLITPESSFWFIVPRRPHHRHNSFHPRLLYGRTLFQKHFLLPVQFRPKDVLEQIARSLVYSLSLAYRKSASTRFFILYQLCDEKGKSYGEKTAANEMDCTRAGRSH